MERKQPVLLALHGPSCPTPTPLSTEDFSNEQLAHGAILSQCRRVATGGRESPPTVNPSSIVPGYRRGLKAASGTTRPVHTQPAGLLPRATAPDLGRFLTPGTRPRGSVITGAAEPVVKRHPRTPCAELASVFIALSGDFPGPDDRITASYKSGRAISGRFFAFPSPP